jgi:hypothetical protein
MRQKSRIDLNMTSYRHPIPDRKFRHFHSLVRSLVWLMSGRIKHYQDKALDEKESLESVSQIDGSSW